jgi:multicomponent Na+:H+ antiporter subunit D
MTSASLLLLTLLLPLATGALVVATGRRPDLREAISLLGSALTAVAAALLLWRVADGERPRLLLAPLLPEAPLLLALEPLGALFACLAAGLWFVTTIYAIGYLRAHGEHHQTRFYACFALALHAVLGIALAGNLLTLFIAYELLTLATFPLVTHAGTPAAARAGRLYLGILLSTSVAFLLPAVLRTHALAGTGDFVSGGALAPAVAAGRADATDLVVLFLLFAFGVGKAALVPFHRWLPAAMVAPTPVSALLHAVAVVKAGVFTLLKVALYVFGLDALRDSGACTPIAWVAGATMLYSALVACRRDDLKERLAWSTIGQLAYIVAGTATATAAGARGAAAHLLVHAFGKITLFFAAGTVIVAAHRTSVRSLRALGRALPVTFVAFAVGALSIIGLPPAAGMWSKWWLGSGLVAGPPLLFAVWLASSFLSACYLLPVAVAAFAPPRPQDGDGHAHDAPGPEPLGCRLAMAITTAGCIALFCGADALHAFLSPLVSP